MTARPQRHSISAKVALNKISRIEQKISMVAKKSALSENSHNPGKNTEKAQVPGKTFHPASA
jgi:hypothetical protein